MVEDSGKIEGFGIGCLVRGLNRESMRLRVAFRNWVWILEMVL